MVETKNRSITILIRNMTVNIVSGSMEDGDAVKDEGAAVIGDAAEEQAETKVTDSEYEEYLQRKEAQRKQRIADGSAIPQDYKWEDVHAMRKELIASGREHSLKVAERMKAWEDRLRRKELDEIRRSGGDWRAASAKYFADEIGEELLV